VRDIDTVAVVNGLKVLDPKRPIREADICPVTPERASVVVTTGRFVRSLGAIAEFPKKKGPGICRSP